MSEAKQLLTEKKTITPLWIVALFVSLTETVLGIAVTQTIGGVQIALTIFVLSFPILIAGSFFVTLWKKPYVFYAPNEFGARTTVTEYVEAMQRRPALASVSSEVHTAQPHTVIEEKAISNFAEELISASTPSGWVMLHACSIAYSKKIAFNLRNLCAALQYTKYDYALGYLIAVTSTGLISAITSGKEHEIWNITDIHERLRHGVRSEFEQFVTNIDNSDDVKKLLSEEIDLVERYF